MQLHAALDAATSIPLSSQLNPLEEGSRLLSSSVFPLDREAIQGMLKSVECTRGAEEDARSRRVREIAEEGWDLFLRVLADGSLVVQAVAVCVYSLNILYNTKAHHIRCRTLTGALLHCSSSSPYCSHRPASYPHPLLYTST